MAKRRTKKRTHKKISEDELNKIPKSMVIHLGQSLKNHSLSQLVSDFRNLMQPYTAINLKERKSNKLKDFIVMCGPLGVQNLFVFNQSLKTGQLSLRIGKLSNGPNLQFKINSYSLCKDVRKILKYPKSLNKDSIEFMNPPLLVMNGFNSNFNEIENHEKLLITIFQNLFPPIQPQSTKVSDIKRVLLISKNKQTQEIEIRHYAINTKLIEENRNVKKLINANHNLKKNLPNLKTNQDISDLLLDPYAIGGMTSDSEVEDDAIVEIKNEEIIKKKQQEEKQDEEKIQENNVRKRAIKLIELGPRLNLSLNKIEENISGSSKVLYHSNVKKSESEIKELNKKHELKQKLKKERREKQQAIVKAKLDKKKRKKSKVDENEDEEMEEEDDEEEEDDDDNEIEINPEDYENDSDLYSDIEV
ncbi:unnamed protein product [Candida verbasci]|uniref:Brix domain-containing protein n=1 Tax=Candida verbasci TaxID=1227364 RepID=A0A9W4X8H4_9ASCO|nr:unnamed protein product [Candida verbasci]